MGFGRARGVRAGALGRRRRLVEAGREARFPDALHALGRRDRAGEGAAFESLRRGLGRGRLRRAAALRRFGGGAARGALHARRGQQVRPADDESRDLRRARRAGDSGRRVVRESSDGVGRHSAARLRARRQPARAGRGARALRGGARVVHRVRQGTTRRGRRVRVRLRVGLRRVPRRGVAGGAGLDGCGVGGRRCLAGGVRGAGRRVSRLQRLREGRRRSSGRGVAGRSRRAAFGGRGEPAPRVRRRADGHGHPLRARRAAEGQPFLQPDARTDGRRAAVVGHSGLRPRGRSGAGARGRQERHQGRRRDLEHGRAPPAQGRQDRVGALERGPLRRALLRRGAARSSRRRK